MQYRWVQCKFSIEDTLMAVTKKSLPTATPAKTPKTKSDKTVEVTPLTSSNLKTARNVSINQ